MSNRSIRTTGGKTELTKCPDISKTRSTRVPQSKELYQLNIIFRRWQSNLIFQVLLYIHALSNLGEVTHQQRKSAKLFKFPFFQKGKGKPGHRHKITTHTTNISAPEKADKTTDLLTRFLEQLPQNVEMLQHPKLRQMKSSEMVCSVTQAHVGPARQLRRHQDLSRYTHQQQKPTDISFETMKKKETQLANSKINSDDQHFGFRKCKTTGTDLRSSQSNLQKMPKRYRHKQEKIRPPHRCYIHGGDDSEPLQDAGDGNPELQSGRGVHAQVADGLAHGVPVLVQRHRTGLGHVQGEGARIHHFGEALESESAPNRVRTLEAARNQSRNGGECERHWFGRGRCPACLGGGGERAQR